MFNLFKYKNMLPSEVYNIGIKEQQIVKVFLEHELEQRQSDAKDSQAMAVFTL